MPGVVPGAMVIVPSGFIVKLPAVGVGAVPGVNETVAKVTDPATPLIVSFNNTDGVETPVVATTGALGSGLATSILQASETNPFIAFA